MIQKIWYIEYFDPFEECYTSHWKVKKQAVDIEKYIIGLRTSFFLYYTLTDQNFCCFTPFFSFNCYQPTEHQSYTNFQSFSFHFPSLLCNHVIWLMQADCTYCFMYREWGTLRCPPTFCAGLQPTPIICAEFELANGTIGCWLGGQSCESDKYIFLRTTQKFLPITIYL